MSKKRALGMSGLPFAGTVSDSLDMVRRIWGVTGLPTLPSTAGMVQFAQSLPQALPSMIAPTLDVEEIDKRIADLRAVEQWLNLNASMLSTAIQSLEVQRNTIATLRSFGGAMLTTMTKPGEVPAAPAGLATTPAVAVVPVVPNPKRRRKAAAAATAGLALNPAVWWNTLHDQFTKVAAAATQPEKKKESGPAPAKPRRRKRAAG
ncbi:MAG: PhaM family polyhydroxyalkanoate granule multifunctional regulatory protein [Gemmatimonadota bacterium]